MKHKAFARIKARVLLRSRLPALLTAKKHLFLANIIWQRNTAMCVPGFPISFSLSICIGIVPHGLYNKALSSHILDCLELHVKKEMRLIGIIQKLNL